VRYEDYAEHLTPAGFLLRINMRNGTFLVYKDGVLQGWSAAGREAKIHPMLHVVFLGSGFHISLRQDSPLLYFPMEGSYVKIPFRFGSESDVRHMRIPLEYEGLDLLPGLAFHFQGFWPTVLPSAGEGRRYFIVDQEMPRQNIMKLKAKYPRSRLIVFKPEDFASIKIDREKIEESGRSRAVDLVDNFADESISQNPVFAARYFLRGLEWRKMYSIPMFAKVKAAEVDIILGFIEKMLKNSEVGEDITPHREDLVALADYYDGVASLMSGDFARIKSWQRKHQQFDRVVLSSLIASAEFQKKFALLEKNISFSSFLRDTVQVLKDIPPDMVVLRE